MDKELLLALEKQYWDAIKNNDAAAASRLSDDRCMVIGPHGIGELDKDLLAGMVKQSPYKLTKYNFDDRDVHVRLISEDVAVIAYQVREDIVVDGRPTSMEAFDSSVWVRRDTTWVCALHTETVKADPVRQTERISPSAIRP